MDDFILRKTVTQLRTDELAMLVRLMRDRRLRAFRSYQNQVTEIRAARYEKWKQKAEKKFKTFRAAIESCDKWLDKLDLLNTQLSAILLEINNEAEVKNVSKKDQRKAEEA